MGIVNSFLNTLRRERTQQEAEDELAFHLDQRIQENISRGMTKDEARLAARKQIGNMASWQDGAVDGDVIQWLEALRRDLRLAWRTIRKSPLFVIVTILSLTLGIGANTIVFTVMKHVLMDSLPVPDADRLVILHAVGVQEGHTSDDGIHSSFSFPQYQELAAGTHSIFSAMLARLSARVTLERQGASSLVNCELVSGNYFAVLGVQPWRGRLLMPADNERPGAHPVVVLGYGLWQRTFGGDLAILNQTLRINGHSYMVVGIAPPRFYGIRLDSPPDLYVPMMMKAQITPTWDGLNDRLDHWATVIAKLQPGVSIARAQSALSVLFPPIRDVELAYIKSPPPAFVHEFAKNRIDLTNGGKGYAAIRQSLEKPLQFVGVMVLVVLLITVVNITNLMIARSGAREREMAVRLSIGAGKGALVRQVLVESSLLALIGGGLGVLLAYIATPILLRALSQDLSQAGIDTHPDGSILFFMAGLTMLAAIGFGLLPALQCAGTDPAVALKADAVSGQTGGTIRLRSLLVGAQITFSMLLLTGALLFTTSLRKLQHIDPGFRTDHLVTFKIDPSGAGYEQARIPIFTEDLLTRLRRLPDVTSAALATSPVLEDNEWGNSVTVEGGAPHTSNESEVLKNLVSTQYFETFRLPLLLGRTLTDEDAGRKVAVVNTAFVAKYIPGQNPIGRHLEFSAGNPKLTWTIVGMVGNTQHRALRGTIEPFVWTPYRTNSKWTALTFYVRAAPDETTLIKSIRQTVREADTSVPLYGLQTMDEVIAKSLFAERDLAALADGFAALAILLAAIGLYGVVSYSVVRRQREFGIRMAIGASPAKVLRAVLRETLWIGTISLACALPLVLLGGRLLRSSLYGVQANDPVICLSAAVILLVVALLAGFVPARQAARTDPQTALRNA